MEKAGTAKQDGDRRTRIAAQRAADQRAQRLNRLLLAGGAVVVVVVGAVVGDVAGGGVVVVGAVGATVVMVSSLAEGIAL